MEVLTKHNEFATMLILVGYVFTGRFVNGTLLKYLPLLGWLSLARLKGTNSNRTVAKFGIAPDFGSGGRGFESHR